jgi:UPF0059 membrane protein HMPREF6123_1810
MKFIINSILLGAGLAMDAVTVSMANGLAEKRMQEKKRWSIAGVYGFFQFLMPLLGWIMVHCLLQYFQKLESLIPWISLGLLLYIGGKMLLAGIQKKEEEAESILTKKDLLLQGIATSIDALSVGFTIAHFTLTEAVLASLIIGGETLILCYFAIGIGKKCGTILSNKAEILGGVILILIGLEIFFF